MEILVVFTLCVCILRIPIMWEEQNPPYVCVLQFDAVVDHVT